MSPPTEGEGSFPSASHKMDTNKKGFEKRSLPLPPQTRPPPRSQSRDDEGPGLPRHPPRGGAGDDRSVGSNISGSGVYVRSDGKKVRRVKRRSNSVGDDGSSLGSMSTAGSGVYIRADGKKVRRVKKSQKTSRPPRIPTHVSVHDNEEKVASTPDDALDSMLDDILTTPNVEQTKSVPIEARRLRIDNDETPDDLLDQKLVMKNSYEKLETRAAESTDESDDMLDDILKSHDEKDKSDNFPERHDEDDDMLDELLTPMAVANKVEVSEAEEGETTNDTVEMLDNLLESRDSESATPIQTPIQGVIDVEPLLAKEKALDAFATNNHLIQVTEKAVATEELPANPWFIEPNDLVNEKDEDETSGDTWATDQEDLENNSDDKATNETSNSRLVEPRVVDPVQLDVNEEATPEKSGPFSMDMDVVAKEEPVPCHVSHQAEAETDLEPVLLDANEEAEPNESGRSSMEPGDPTHLEVNFEAKPEKTGPLLSMESEASTKEVLSPIDEFWMKDEIKSTPPALSPVDHLSVRPMEAPKTPDWDESVLPKSGPQLLKASESVVAQHFTFSPEKARYRAAEMMGEAVHSDANGSVRHAVQPLHQPAPPPPAAVDHLDRAIGSGSRCSFLSGKLYPFTEATKRDKSGETEQSGDLGQVASKEGTAPRTPKRVLPETLMATTRSRADVDAYVTPPRTPATPRSRAGAAHLVDINDDDDAYIMQTTLARKRVKVVQLLLFGLLGLAFGFLGSFYVQSSCHFVTARVEVGGNSEDFNLHYGMWKYSPINSAFDGYAYCYTYDGQFTSDAPILPRIAGLSALMTGVYSLAVLWVYLVLGRTTENHWRRAVYSCVFAGAFQALTMLFFADSVCRRNSCSIGPGAVVSIAAALTWFLVAFEMKYNTPISSGANEVTTNMDGESGIVESLEMSDVRAAFFWRPHPPPDRNQYSQDGSSDYPGYVPPIV